MSWALYQRVLPQSVVDSIVHDTSAKHREEEKEKKKTETPPTRSSYSWFPWRNRGSQKATPEKTDSTTNTGDLTSETETDGPYHFIFRFELNEMLTGGDHRHR